DTDCLPSPAPAGSCDNKVHGDGTPTTFRCITSCNDVCTNGHCSANNFTNCTCESAGDRARTPGVTACCGLQGARKRSPESCGAPTECCSGICAGGFCTGAAVSCKRSGTICASGAECCSQSCGVTNPGLCDTVTPSDLNCKNLKNDRHNCGACNFDCG